MNDEPKTRQATSSRYLANMGGVVAVDRALTIVEALEAATVPQSLATLANTTGLYKSGILRLMATLIAHGLVVRRDDQTFVLGPLAFRLGRAFEQTDHLAQTLTPVMLALVDRGLESPSFHIVQDASTRLCVLRFDSRHSTLDRVRVGDVLPLQRGAPGKVLRHLLPGGPVDPETLVQYSFGERDPSCGAVAGPVFGAGGDLLGALSLSGPLTRFTPAATKKMARSLLAACAEATTNLGGRWPVSGRVDAKAVGNEPPVPIVAPTTRRKPTRGKPAR